MKVAHIGAMADVYRQQAEDQMQQALTNVRGQQVLYQPGGGSRGDIFAAQAAASWSEGSSTESSRIIWWRLPTGTSRTYASSTDGYRRTTVWNGLWPAGYAGGTSRGRYGIQA